MMAVGSVIRICSNDGAHLVVGILINQFIPWTNGVRRHHGVQVNLARVIHTVANQARVDHTVVNQARVDGLHQA